MPVPSWLWILFTLAASCGQVLRNAMQRELIQTLGTVGATHVRFLFGLPFSLLFLAIVRITTGLAIPTPGPLSLAWTIVGALAQIIATGLMLASMRERSFVVTTAYIKTEPVQVAIFALVFLGDRLSFVTTAAILVAMCGVMLMSWPKRRFPGEDKAGSWKPAALGIVAGGFFALSAVGFRGGIRDLDTPSFIMAASTTLVIGLFLQTTVLTLYLGLFDRRILLSIFRAWRPSMLAGFTGALASQFWFLAFAIETAARVRTLALIEIVLAHLVSRNVFRQSASGRELAGMALIVAGVVLLVNG